MRFAKHIANIRAAAANAALGAAMCERQPGYLPPRGPEAPAMR
jgi:hypothetical protein